MNLLFIGDVVGKGGREAVRLLVPELRREFNCQFVIVNAENSAAGSGLTSGCARELLESADVLTSGDHVWDQRGFDAEIDRFDRVLRPANLQQGQPGRGWGVYRNPAGGEIAVINLQGKVFMRESAYNPFETVERILAEELPKSVKSIFVDFHAEATSEKLAMAYYLDGRVSAIWGTHTHVPTADEEVFPKGTGYLTDLGMTGAVRSVLGIKPEQSVETFLGGLPGRYREPEKSAGKMQGAIFTLDDATGLCVGVERVDVR